MPMSLNLRGVLCSYLINKNNESDMAKDFQGIALGLAARFAGSPLAEKYNLRKPAEKLAFKSTKSFIEFVQKNNKKKDGKSKKPAGPMFDLSLNEEQQMIRDSIRSYAEHSLRPLALVADEDSKLPENLMQESLDLGLNFFAVPESLGGAGQQSPITSMLIAEDLGWGDFSLAYPILSTMSVVNAIARWGNKSQQELLLPQFCGEDAISAAVAVQEPGALFRADKLKTKASANNNGYVLSGTKALLPFGGKGSIFLVAAEYKGENRIFLVNADAKGVSWKSTPSMGLRGAEVGSLKLDKVQVPKHALLGDDKFDYQQFVDSGTLMWCAMACGCCEAALDYLVPYVNEREAFGEPISHRQSVAFMIADLKIELDSMRMLTWRAVSRAEQGLDFHREAFLAHQLCTEKAMEIGTNAVQLLGGHGFTKEHPAERWYRDLRVLSAMNGGLHL